MGLVLLVLASACSSSGTLAVKTPKAGSLPPGKVVALTVQAPADSDSQDAANRMRNDLFGRLVAEGVFKQVVQPGQPADYQMTMSLSGVEEVSQTARIFLGVFAGSNELKADVTLVDTNRAVTVEAFQVTGQSASHPLSSQNGIEDAVREAAVKTVQALR
jgi:hypothetical protein